MQPELRKFPARPGIADLLDVLAVQTQDASHQPQHIGALGFRGLEITHKQVPHQDPTKEGEAEEEEEVKQGLKVSA